VRKPLDREVAAALAHAGLRVRGFHSLSTIPFASTGRAAYRVDLETGRTIKARRVEDEKTARRLFEIRRDLPAAFAPAFDQHGTVLLEDWIEGEELGGACPSDAHVTDAAELLAQLHATEILAGHPMHERRSTTGWREETERGLRDIFAAGALRAWDAPMLRATLERLDPGTAIVGLVHTDFCGENMVVDRAGRLHVVDNERVSVDALGFDVGRTWYRWTLPSLAWERFRSTYAARMPFLEPLETLGFWSVVAVVKSAAIRLRWDRARAHVPLDRLRRMAVTLGNRRTPLRGHR
jgi:thiamine kinase-like enzyme